MVSYVEVLIRQRVAGLELAICDREGAAEAGVVSVKHLSLRPLPSTSRTVHSRSHPYPYASQESWRLSRLTGTCCALRASPLKVITFIWICVMTALTCVIGDLPTLSAARNHVRSVFEENRSLSPASEEYTKSVAEAEEVAKFLKHNVVQGQALGDEEGSYSE